MQVVYYAYKIWKDAKTQDYQLWQTTFQYFWNHILSSSRMFEIMKWIKKTIYAKNIDDLKCVTVFTTTTCEILLQNKIS